MMRWIAEIPTEGIRESNSNSRTRHISGSLDVAAPAFLLADVALRL